MTELTRAVSAESLKLKRTLALRLAVIAPLFIVLLQLGVYLARGEDVERAATNPAAGFARGIVTLWTLAFLPFWATLAASLLRIAGSQRQPLGPDVRVTHAPLACLCCQWILSFRTGSVKFDLPAALRGCCDRDPQASARRMERCWAAMAVVAERSEPELRACLLLISLQCWLSLRWHSFLVALGVGIAGIMSGIILISAPLRFLSLYPWTAAAAAASPREPLLPLVWGMCGGLAIAVIACWRLAVRDRY